MSNTINWLEQIYAQIPLSLLEVWGQFGFFVGLIFMVAAFGGYTFRPGGNWGLGREKQSWDSVAIFSMLFTFLAIIGTGYIGSSIVLVPGAQTFESLKDLTVFLCVVLFGYPALIIVPFAYGISDLVEGVPPEFLKDWFFGYFINPACFWIAYQLIGKNPDFFKWKTWRSYLIFVFVFMFLEPQLWGHICAGKFTADISYRNITPALFFTTSITWILAPFAMMLAYPLAKKYKYFWADIPGHVKERFLNHDAWIWESGVSKPLNNHNHKNTIPIRLFLVAPFIILMLTMIASTAFFTLSSSEKAASKLAERLHLEIAENFNNLLDEYLDKSTYSETAVTSMLKNIQISKTGRALIINREGKIIATSFEGKDIVVNEALKKLNAETSELKNLENVKQFEFLVITAKPLARTSWIAQATPYKDRKGGHSDWILLTAIPETFYLEGVQTGNAQSAQVFAVALALSLIIAAFLATVVTTPIVNISKATQALALGELTQEIPLSRLEELGLLSESFNHMTKQLQKSFDELKESQNRLTLAIHAGNLGIWDWNIEQNILVWDDGMYKMYGIKPEDFKGAYEAWASMLDPEDFNKVSENVRAALKGEADFSSEFRVNWKDGSNHYIKGIGQLIHDKNGKAVRMVGINYEITELKNNEKELLRYRNELEKLVTERTEELSRKTSQLEASNKELESFSYSVSHDLRAPLRGIDGWSLALLEDYGTIMDEKALSYLKRVRSESQRMGVLIDDLLKLSRLTRTEVKKEKVNLSSIVTVVAERLKEENKTRVLKFNIQQDVWIEADSHLMEIVITNLLNNACKFTKNVSEPVLEFGKTTKNNIDTYFIKDNGAGFNMAAAKNLFGAFQRFHKEAEFPGTGIGLAMVKRIITLHRGTIWAESAVSKGATFYFTLNE